MYREIQISGQKFLDFSDFTTDKYLDLQQNKFYGNLWSQLIYIKWENLVYCTLFQK